MLALCVPAAGPEFSLYPGEPLAVSFSAPFTTACRVCGAARPVFISRSAWKLYTAPQYSTSVPYICQFLNVPVKIIRKIQCCPTPVPPRPLKTSSCRHRRPPSEDCANAIISRLIMPKPLEIARFLSISRGFPLERIMGIEPTSTAWEAVVLPMNYIRVFCLLVYSTKIYPKCQARKRIHSL